MTAKAAAWENAVLKQLPPAGVFTMHLALLCTK